VRFLAASLILLGTCDLAFAGHVPLPRPRPPALAAAANGSLLSYKLAARPPSPEQESVRTDAQAGAGPSACVWRLTQIAQIAELPGVNGPGECDAGDVVRLEKVVMPDGSLVALSPPATLACPMAEAAAHWVRDDVGPAAADLDSSPVGIATHASYDCRSRNNVRGAKMSEHGRGNALDIGAIKLANGTVIDLTSRSASASFRQRVRVATCQRFNTVLGPGSDAFHEKHIHVDLAVRSRGYRMCQWDVRGPVEMAEPALPPTEATAAKVVTRKETAAEKADARKAAAALNVKARKADAVQFNARRAARRR
jgi:hypothetical protein